LDIRPVLKLDCSAAIGAFQLNLQAVLNCNFTAMFGPSGCGKTSTLKLIAGLITPDAGEIAIDGQPVFDRKNKINIPPEQREAGLVFQDARLFPHLTVKQNLEFGLKNTPADKRKLSLKEVSDVLKINHLLNRKPATLSGGETQRVAIGRALLTSPKLLLMDEPLAAIDQPSKLAIIVELQRIRKAFDLPILYVSHDIGTVLNIASHVVLMDAGKVIAEGKPFDVLADYVSKPMITNEEIRNIVEAEIIRHHDAKGTTEVRSQDTIFVLPKLPQPEGEKLKIDIPASEIILAIEKPAGLSARNILDGRVVEIRHLGHRVVVVVDAGLTLYVEVVEGTLSGLNLAIGKKVFLVIKATSFRKVG
jgi:molybdate transport system ATP-binding protein